MMQYSKARSYNDPDINGIDRKDKLLKNKMLDEMLVLKDKYQVTMSDSDKRKLSQEYDKLYKFNYEINRTNEKINNQGDLLNLTLREIFDKLVKTLILVIDDISNLDLNNIKLEEIIDILTKKDRQIYLGVIMVIISIMLFFMFITK
jgi:hypothetical protein